LPSASLIGACELQARSDSLRSSSRARIPLSPPNNSFNFLGILADSLRDDFSSPRPSIRSILRVSSQGRGRPGAEVTFGSDIVWSPDRSACTSPECRQGGRRLVVGVPPSADPRSVEEGTPRRVVSCSTGRSCPSGGQGRTPNQSSHHRQGLQDVFAVA